ncbi:hypothetical protein [Polaribacter tangerinus]|uniref:hypothetical protein n=1 Tax=Polaribacter tangerinus TaxID=1920034 RepID=UPI000B4AAFBD|nr:hypothetical protein [Polaribacter tangerinus]
MQSYKNNNFFILAISVLFIAILGCSSKKNISSNYLFVQEAAAYQKKAPENILYIVDGKKVNSNYLRTLAPEKIKSLTVVKDSEKMKKFTEKKYQGIIVILLKK